MILLITCIFGTLFAFQKRINLFILVFLFSLFLMPLLLYLFNPLWFQYRGYVPIYLTIILLLSNVDILFHSDVFKKNILSLLLIISIFIAILAICAAINNYNVLSAINYFKHFFWPFLLYITLVSLGIDNLNLTKYLYVFVILQIAMGSLQYIGGEAFSKSFYFYEVIKDGNVTMISSKHLVEAKGAIISGTMGKVTILGNTLAICLTYLFGYKLHKHQKFTINEIALFLATFLIVVLTGVRGSLATCVIGCMLCYLFITKNMNSTIKKIAIIILITIIVSPFLVALGHEAIQSRADYGNTFQRSLTLFGTIDELFEDNSASHLYTLKRSVYISKFMDLKAFFVGTGVYMNDVKGYGSGISSITDASLLFTIVEFGIIVFLMCIVPYAFSLRDIKQNCDQTIFRLCLILFSVVLLQTIVDQGIFDNRSSFLLFLLFASLGINNNKSKEDFIEFESS